MTYRIEITADSLNELAGRVLAMAAQFQTTSYEPPVIVVHHGEDEVIEPRPVPAPIPFGAGGFGTPTGEPATRPDEGGSTSEPPAPRPDESKSDAPLSDTTPS